MVVPHLLKISQLSDLRSDCSRKIAVALNPPIGWPIGELAIRKLESHLITSVLARRLALPLPSLSSLVLHTCQRC